MLRTVLCRVLGIATVFMGVLAVAYIGSFATDGRIETTPFGEILNAYDEQTRHGDLVIDYPLDGTLFPPEAVSPTFCWEDGTGDADTWLVKIDFQDAEGSSHAVSHQPAWTPDGELWQAIKRRSLERTTKVTVLGFNRAAAKRLLSAGTVSIRVSKDETGAPILYREVNLPFIEAVKDPSRIRWRFGPISSKEPPPVVLENLPVCGNCHSFSHDGAVMGMDVDYANNKGSYVIAPVSEEIVLDKQKILTWSDFRKEDNQQTLGLLSQVSPDGRYVVSTVKDQSVFVPLPDLTFSQLFFPIQGILAIYDREARTFHALPGADDPRLVQSNPTWSPDGRYIVFARSEAYRLKNVRDGGSALLTEQECAEFLQEGKKFRFDLYRIPFNGGKGGKAEPLEGACHNRKSNYFARYSPNGKWIVFCQADSYMLLQPDSELYIVAAEGGQARRLECNTQRMNSWHSWSPNSKWLVFSSKSNSAYTQLFLTHIDEHTGQSSPPVLLSQFTAADRAANIPEFVNTTAEAIRTIHEQFVDDYSYARAGIQMREQDDLDAAERLLRKALQLNSGNADAHCTLGYVLAERGKLEEAKVHFALAIESAPDQWNAHYNLGSLLSVQGQFPKAVTHYCEAVRINPGSFQTQFSLGMALMTTGRLDEASVHFFEALRLRPDDYFAHYQLGYIAHRQGKLEQAASHYGPAIHERPSFVRGIVALACIRAWGKDAEVRNVDEAVTLAARAYELTGGQDSAVLDILVGTCITADRRRDAMSVASRVLQIDDAVEDEDSASRIRERLKSYEERNATRHSSHPSLDEFQTFLRQFSAIEPENQAVN